ncbi:MAG TPA: aspartate/glutamate racemase family protein [Ignavibacteria bacterium]
MKIGICDYGIGGIGLYKLIRAKTTVDIVYFSDSGYTPYGKVSEKELKKRLDQIIKYFNIIGVFNIAVACNSASTVIPKNNNITGIIEHGINMVLKIHPTNIAIVGGARTLESQSYKTAFERRGIQTTQQTAQQLSIRVEAGDIASAELDKDIRDIFGPIKDFEYILLACTHYPVIADRIKLFTRNAKLLDPVNEMADWIFDNWTKLAGNSTVKWITTGNIEQMKIAANVAFQGEIEEIEKISI